MSQDYYRVIAGKKYDNQMIEIAEESVAGRGDGRISLDDAHRLIGAVKDANLYTDIEKATMRYIRDHFRFTPAADKWFRTEIRKWAATKAWAAHSGERKEAADRTSASVPVEKEEEPAIPPAAPEVPAADHIPPVARREKEPERGFNWKIALAAGAMVVLIAAVVYSIWPTAPSTPEPVAGKEEPAAAASLASNASDDSSASVRGPSAGEESKAASIPREEEAPAPASADAGAAPASAAIPAAPADAAAPPVREEAPPAAAAGSAALQEKKEPPPAPEPGTRGGSHIVQKGESLWSIAGLWYRDPTVWPNLYRVNRERIPDPNLILLRMAIAVPPLEGKDSAWTPRDRSLIAAGYVDAYRAYRKLGRSGARLYLLQAGKWDATVMERLKDLGR